MEQTSVAALWWAVIAAGIYHGVNPGMGWPLSVSAALFEQKRSALFKALGLLAFGHFLAMTAILLPFSVMFVLVDYEREIRIGAGALVIAAGLYLLINRRHPRALSRVKPSRLALWSFLAAMAHGAGLMLVPLYLGLCDIDALDSGHRAANALMTSNFLTALYVALAHTAAMTISGGIIAWAVYTWMGLKFLSKSWFNIDLLWALSLIAVGLFGIWTAH